jgi:outer membrane immunogenic protein
MRKILGAGVGLIALAIATQQAAAADLPVRQAPAYKAPEVVEVFTWTGFYIGIHGGGGWGSKVANQVPLVTPGGTITSPEATTNISGGLAGGQIGFNYQMGHWVGGLEAQASWADLTGSTPCSILLAGAPVTTACTGTSKVDALGTVAARLGVAFDRTLLYAKGGGAWTHDKYNVAVTSAVLPPTANASETRWGWMVGAGIEHAFTNHLSAKIEYNYMDLGTERVRFTASDGTTNDADIRQRVHVVKVGLNYRFGGPVYAKY